MSFSIGEGVAREITNAVSGSSQVTDDTDFTIKVAFDGILIDSKEVTIKRNNLSTALFTFDGIPFNKQFKVLVDVSFNNIIIYSGESNPITLSKDSDGLNVNINIKRRNGVISFEANGGTINGTSDGKAFVQEYFITDNLSESNLPVVEKKGYAFNGWYYDEKCQKPVESIGKNNFIGDVKLFAKLTPITYTVQFDGNDCDPYLEMAPQTMTFDEVKALTKNTFTKSGFEFAGWNTEKTPSDAADNILDETSRAFNFKSVQDEVQVLYAQWNDIAPGPVKNFRAVLNGARDSVHLSWDNPSDRDLEKVVITCEGTTINQKISDRSRNIEISIAEYSAKDIFTFKATTVDRGNNSCAAAEIPSASCDKNEYTVGDIIMTDGTYITKDQISGYSGTAKPVAIIFSVKSGNIPAKGVGLYAQTSAWATGTGANTNFEAIIDSNIEDMDGSDNWGEIKKVDVNADTNISQYPAFNFANNYGTDPDFVDTIYSSGWYLPSMGELVELGKMKNYQSFDGLLDVIINALKSKFTGSGKSYLSVTGDKVNLWSSNQGRSAEYARSLYLGHSNYSENKDKSRDGSSGSPADRMNACAVRKFEKQ